MTNKVVEAKTVWGIDDHEIYVEGTGKNDAFSGDILGTDVLVIGKPKDEQERKEILRKVHRWLVK